MALPLQNQRLRAMSDSRVLLITSNGWGLGHLIRQLTISDELPKDVPSVILTLSQGAAIAARTNLEYAPSYSQPWISKGKWHGGYLRDRILLLVDEFKPTVIVFDGVVPYVGLLDAISRLEIPTVWMRRGLWRKTTNPKPLTDSHWFDLILEPGDIGDALDTGPTSKRTDAKKIGVITAADATKAISRESAAEKLGVDPSQKTLLFNLGSSALEGDLDQIADVLNDFPQWQVITTKDELGRSKSFSMHNKIHTIRGIFPLHPYLAAVDLAVSSVGYNAAHEFVGMAVPAIYVAAPNVTDDQFARARAIADAGAGWIVENQTASELARTLRSVLEDASVEIAEKRNNCIAIQKSWKSGAKTAAELILTARRGTHPNRVARLKLRLRVLSELYLGNIARRTKPAKFSVITTTRELNSELLNSQIPFEHILPAASSEYESKRIALSNKWFKG
jgi:hypothetical protein